METELVRGEVSKAIDPLLFEEESRAELAKQASSLLGYEKLHDQISWKASKIKQIQIAVEAAKLAFANIGLEPLTDESVQTYKAKKVQRETRKCLWRNFCNSDKGISAMTAFPVTAIFGIFIICFSLMLSESFHMMTVNHFLVRIAPAYSLLCAWSFLMWPIIAAYRVQTKRTAYTFSWSRHSMRHFQDEIPQFAIAHAVALKKELPEATFDVESFVRNGYQSRSVPDPFLVMNLNGVDFYIDVWNEPKYEARKTV